MILTVTQFLVREVVKNCFPPTPFSIFDKEKLKDMGIVMVAKFVYT